MKRGCFIIILFAIIFSSIQAQSFLCDGSFYIIGQDGNESFLKAFRADNVAETREIPLSEPERRYTCLGMSIEDMHLYALDFDTKELLRINAAGTVVSLGVPENLNTDLEYWAGNVSPGGRRLVVIGKDKTTNQDERVYSISLTTENHYAGSSRVVSDRSTAITDIAVDPIRGTMYGYDRNNKQIVSIATNIITHHQHSNVDIFLEGLFFDRKGNLFGYGGGGEVEQSILYSINKNNGEMDAVKSVSKGSYSDGCSCPYTLKFYRTVVPEILVPCEEFTIYYTIINEAGEGKLGGFLEDTLPEDFVITQLVEHTYTLATAESSVGSNRFYIPNLDILIGKNVIVLKGILNPTDVNRFETQASLQGLSIGLGGDLYSDNPVTTTSPDANINVTVQGKDLELEDFIEFDCEQTSAVLKLPFRADTYLWNDGSMDETLVVSDTGWYWVEAESECIQISDSIFIANFPEPLQLDLGEGLQVQQGEAIQLQFESNIDVVQQLKWSSRIPSNLSCDNCANPTFTALGNNTYYLELNDERGCTISDSLQVKVEKVKDIFVSNAFSPNGDGENETFAIQGIEGLANISQFQIFDRWGNLVFSVKDIPINDGLAAWDGHWKGDLMPSGSYVWIAEIEFLDQEILYLNGTVALLSEYRK